MRNFLIAVALLFGLIFIFSNFAELQPVFETIQRGDWRFIALAAVIQIIWLVNIAASYRVIYQLLGIEFGLQNLFLAAAAANFVNVVTPSGGVGGLAVLIDHSKNRGVSTARATLASVLHLLFEYAGLICAISLGLIVLLRRNNLNAPELVATAILLLVTGVIAMILYLGMKSEKAMADALALLARLVNRLVRPFLRRNYLSEERGRRFAHEAASGLAEIRRRPKDLIWPFGLSLSNKALLLTIFFLMFIAFKVPFSTGTLIAGFSIAYLFTIVSPTPGGIGVVESLLTVSLRSLNVPLGSAAVITLAYRGVTFWLPLLIGMLALRRVSKETASSAT